MTKYHCAVIHKGVITCNLLMKKLFFIALLFLTSTGFLKAQVVQVTPMAIQQLVQNVLVGEGVEISNITYSGAPDAIGMYIAPTGLFGADTGLVLTSGTIYSVPGPNFEQGAGANNGYPGDAQLNALTTNSTNDAAVIEFDLKPSSDTIRFEYIFGSEEYMEYVGSNYNDVFGFFLTGPGLPPGGVNLAVLPSSTTPITINSINNSINSNYYIDNPPFTSTPLSQALQYDGITTLLRAEYYPATPGETYHIKIAIADAFDFNFDSGVFLKGKSFSSPSICDSMTVLATIIPVSCVGGNNGSINIDSVAGGQGPYYFSLNDGAFLNQAQFDTLMAGNYNLSVMDSNGCISSQGVVVMQPDRKLRFFTTFRKSKVCPDCSNGKIVASGIGGVGPYQYSLDGENYKDSGVFENLAPGTYTLYMKDAFGCIITRTVLLG